MVKFLTKEGSVHHIRHVSLHFATVLRTWQTLAPLDRIFCSYTGAFVPIWKLCPETATEVKDRIEDVREKCEKMCEEEQEKVNEKLERERTRFLGRFTRNGG